mmetsp:Transcript_15346/g.13880  ORF Transcript_15346/g.13880 Transcript_15346/m.13880 type:complete len:116 (-) Transcript_15346:68-415(-)
MSSGYAKLSGRIGNESSYEDIELILTKLPSTIGRSADLVIQSKLSKEIDITLSRVHAIIDFKQPLKSFIIECDSKNGMIVDGKKYNKGEFATLTNRSRIKIGSARVYFLLPVDSS